MIDQKQKVLRLTAPNGVTKINTTHFNLDFIIRKRLIYLSHSLRSDAYDQKDINYLIKNFLSEIQNLRLITKIGEKL